MLSTIRIVMISIIMAATTIPTFAASESRSNSSETVVWGFLGLCALIIIAQITPLIRNIKKQSKIASEQPKAVKIEQM